MSKRATKTQRDLLNLLATPVEGCAIDVIWVPENYCGVTEACQMATDRSRRSLELPSVGHASSSSAWDAMRMLASSAHNPGTCYWSLALSAIRSHEGKSHNGCAFLFDNAQGFMDCSSVDLSVESASRASKWEKIVTAFEDAQRGVGIPVRLVFFVYKASILVRRDTNGRSVGVNKPQFPRVATRFMDRVQGWRWTRNTLETIKQKAAFAFFETVEEESRERTVKHA